jgi:hypothetical protein
MDDLITRAVALSRGAHILSTEASELADRLKAHKASTEKPEKVSDITGFPEDDSEDEGD